MRVSGIRILPLKYCLLATLAAGCGGGIKPIDSSGGCPAGAVYEGTIIITRAQDVSRLDGYTCVHGSVRFEFEGTVDIPEITPELGGREIEEITGSLVFQDGQGLLIFEGFPALEKIGGVLSISNCPVLGEIRLSSLNTISGGLEVTGALGGDVLKNLYLPSLRSPGGSIYINNTSALLNLKGGISSQ